MKKFHVLLFSILLSLTFLLSACTGGPRVSGAPGLTLSGDQAFLSYGNSLFSLNADNGTVNWSFPEKPNNQILFFAQPFAYENHIFVGDTAKNFYKIDRTSGNSVWTFSEAKGYFIGQANAAKEMVYAPNNDGKLYALDSQGNLQWAFETGHYLWSQPQIGMKAIYLSSMDKFIYAISMEGEQLWAAEMAGAVVANPILSEDESTLYVGSLGKDFLALNTTDGSIVWSFSADDSIWGNALLVDETLYFADSSGNLYLLDPISGTEKNRIAISESVIGGLVAVPDGFALVTEKGTLKVLNLDGSLKLSYNEILGNVFQSPVTNEKQLMVSIVSTEKEYDVIHTFDLDSGENIWSKTP